MLGEANNPRAGAGIALTAKSVWQATDPPDGRRRSTVENQGILGPCNDICGPTKDGQRRREGRIGHFTSTELDNDGNAREIQGRIAGRPQSDWRAAAPPSLGMSVAYVGTATVLRSSGPTTGRCAATRVLWASSVTVVQMRFH